ncbi:MAG: CRISPR-associated endoribonuclease Cas6 [bacterium]
MRLQLTLRPFTPNATVPINYQYPLSAAIYKILQQASPDYASFLHDRGYPAPSGRMMKLFSFSKLWIPGGRRFGETLRGGQAPWQLQIGSPMLDEFVQNFVLGLFDACEITIAAHGLRAQFTVEGVETLAVPEFEHTMRFKCLSPITASTMVDRQGRKQIHYYRPDDAGLPEALRQNLLQKYEIIHARPPENSALTFRFEASDRPRQKLITIKQGTPEETRVACFESYFTLAGSPALMQTAWECGLGERGSQGFGMVECLE